MAEHSSLNNAFEPIFMPIDRAYKKAFVLDSTAKTQDREWYDASVFLFFSFSSFFHGDNHQMFDVNKNRQKNLSLRIKIFIFFACAFQLFLKYLAMSISNWAELADEHNFPLDWAPYCSRANSRFLRSLSFPGSFAQLLHAAKAKLYTRALGWQAATGGWEGRGGKLAKELKKVITIRGKRVSTFLGVLRGISLWRHRSLFLFSRPPSFAILFSLWNEMTELAS